MPKGFENVIYERPNPAVTRGPFMFGVFSLIGDAALLVALVFVKVSNKISREICREEDS